MTAHPTLTTNQKPRLGQSLQSTLIEQSQFRSWRGNAGLARQQGPVSFLNGSWCGVVWCGAVLHSAGVGLYTELTKRRHYCPWSIGHKNSKPRTPSPDKRWLRNRKFRFSVTIRWLAVSQLVAIRNLKLKRKKKCSLPVPFPELKQTVVDHQLTEKQADESWRA